MLPWEKGRCVAFRRRKTPSGWFGVGQNRISRLFQICFRNFVSRDVFDLFSPYYQLYLGFLY
jgi:hypothetical protein